MTRTLEAAVTRAGDAVVIELTGDIDGNARDVLEAAYTEPPNGAARSCWLPSESTTSTRPASR